MTAAAERAGAEADGTPRRRVTTEPTLGPSPESASDSGLRAAHLTADPATATRPTRRPSATMNPRSMALLQRSAGNAAVAGLLRAPRGPGTSPAAGASATAG